jgi:hypothetical protein
VPSLSTTLSDPGAVPYFLWDDPMTVAELKVHLESASESERLRLPALILHEPETPTFGSS